MSGLEKAQLNCWSKIPSRLPTNSEKNCQPPSRFCGQTANGMILIITPASPQFFFQQALPDVQRIIQMRT
jgi:hypothetical protein